MMHYYQYEKLPAYVSQYLKWKMEAEHLTREVVAQRAGVSVRTVQRWRNGEIQYLEIVGKIACGLQVSVGEIFSAWEDDPYAHSLYMKTPVQDQLHGCFLKKIQTKIDKILLKIKRYYVQYK